jgi:hypothetical protein
MQQKKTRPAEFQYSAVERKEILKALPTRITEKKRLAAEITFWAWDARTLASWGMLYGGSTQKQLLALGSMASDLRSSIQNLPRLVFLILDGTLSNASPSGGVKDWAFGTLQRIQTMLATLETGIGNLSCTPLGRKTGAPGDLWLLFFGWKLYEIYWRETGERPARRTDQYGKGEYGPFRDFLISCMKPTKLLRSDSTVDGLIRKLVSNPPISSRPDSSTVDDRILDFVRGLPVALR